MKSIRIRSFSAPYFPAFGLNRERYVFSKTEYVEKRIQSKCKKIQTRKTPNTDTSHAVIRDVFRSLSIIYDRGFYKICYHLLKERGQSLNHWKNRTDARLFFFLHCLIQHMIGSFNRKFNRKSKVFYYHSPFTGVRSSNPNSMEHWHCVRYSEMKDFIWSVFYMTKNNPHFFVFQPILWHWFFSKAPENIWISEICVVSTYLYGAFGCMFLLCHVHVSEWVRTL